MCNRILELTKDVAKKETTNVPLEKALDLTGFGKYNYFVMFVCSITMLASITEVFGLSFIVQSGACDLELDLEQRGILSSVPMIGIVFSAYFWGYLTDMKGRRNTLHWSMSVASLASVLSSFSINMGMLAFFKIISVTFSSASLASTYTLLGEFQPKKYRDRSLVFLTCANVLTESLIVMIAYPLLTYSNFEYSIPLLGIIYKPWRLLIVLLGLPLALSAICLKFTSESPKFLVSQGKDKQAVEVLRKMFVWNNTSDGSNYPVDSLMLTEDHSESPDGSILMTMWSQCIPLFKAPYLKYTCLLYFMIFWICFISNAFIMWLPYTVNKFIENLEITEMQNENFCTVFTFNSIILNNTIESGSINTETCVDTINVPTYITVGAFSIGGLVITATLAMLVNYVSKKILMITLLLICGFCGFIIHWVPVPMVGLVLFILFNYEFTVVGLISPLIVEIYPTYIRGMAGCLSIMMARTGSFLGIYIAGITFEHYCEPTFFIYTFLLLICSVAAYCLPNITIKSIDHPQNTP